MKRFSFLSAALMLICAHSLFGVGALYVRPLRSNDQHKLMTIKTYDASTVIENQVATTTVDQVFFNDDSNNSMVEATYIFPLPEGAVITQLAYWYNGNKYIANIRTKQEAQASYDSTIRRLLDPAILQYFGTNTFKLNIAPINPKTEVRFSITYTELLKYDFNKITFNFYLKTTGLSPKPLERVSLRINVRTTSDITRLSSPSHGNTPENLITRVSEREYNVSYGDEQFTPDRDYRLEFEYQRAGLNVNVLTYTPVEEDSVGKDGFFATWVIPSDDINTSTLPRSVVFTVDVSSSMEGKRIDQLRTGLTTFVNNLHEQDYFNIVLFSTNVQRFRPDLVPATSKNIAEAKDYISKNINAKGLTNINDALVDSFRHTFRDSSVKFIAFLTDGLQSWGVLDSNVIIDNVRKLHSDVRVFTYGIGDEPSRYLLNNIASVSGGYATYISNEDSIATVVASQFQRLSKAVLSDLSLNYGGLDYYDLMPAQLPDLLYGSQVLQLGRYRNSGTFPITLSGNVLEVPFRLSTNATFMNTPGGNRSVSRLWAGAKINSLLADIDIYGEKKELVDAIIDLSIRFQILTKYTALYSDPNKDKASIVNEFAGNVQYTSVLPNPTSDHCTIRVSLGVDFKPQRLTVNIYNCLGQLVARVADGLYTSGENDFSWNTCDMYGAPVQSGLYMARIETETGSISIPIHLIR